MDFKGVLFGTRVFGGGVSFMKVLFNVLQAIGLLVVLFGIGCIESPSIVPFICIVAGSGIFAIGYKGEQQYVTL